MEEGLVELGNHGLEPAPPVDDLLEESGAQGLGHVVVGQSDLDVGIEGVFLHWHCLQDLHRQAVLAVACVPVFVGLEAIVIDALNLLGVSRARKILRISGGERDHHSSLARSAANPVHVQVLSLHVGLPDDFTPQISKHGRQEGQAFPSVRREVLLGVGNGVLEKAEGGAHDQLSPSLQLEQNEGQLLLLGSDVCLEVRLGNPSGWSDCRRGHERKKGW
mmetsp:Transcript_37932/g.81034  ORF Transcript_37932/g.81034 Transcript_37932/m.81034 type:complete len:219 (-) Transcript_37932:1222-1878(-)